MAGRVWFQLVRASAAAPQGYVPFAGMPEDFVQLTDDMDVYHLREAICDKYRQQEPNLLQGIPAQLLKIYADQAAYNANTPCSSRLPLSELDILATLFVEVPPLTQVRWENFVDWESFLEVKEPKRLCASLGQDWSYQGASELADRLVEPLVQHFDAWQRHNHDKQNHAINLVLSGPGTGKSRMLDEMKTLLCEAAARSHNQALMARMKDAFEFRVTFENGTASAGSLLDPVHPEFDISYRMLYQLAKNNKPWGVFADKLSEVCGFHRLRIPTAIEILAKLRQIDNVEDMTVILCVDGLQKLVNDGTKTCDFYRVLTCICSFVNASPAFAVCVCSATVQLPIRQALADSAQKREFLIPPPLQGDLVLAPRTRLERQLVEDMGGHGRALEVLQREMSRYTREELEQMDPISVVTSVHNALKRQYGDVFESPIFDDETNCKEVVVAILSRRSFATVFARIGQTNLTVDDIRSFGLIRVGERGELVCAFVFLVALIKRLPKRQGEVDNFDDHITCSSLVWQRFEQFVAFYRRVKSIAYCKTPVLLSDFHSGARFGAINRVLITEPSSRKVVEAVHQEVTKSSPGCDSTFLTNRHDSVKLSDLDTIVINGSSAPAGDLFMRVQLTVGDEEVLCNEVIQCKLLLTKQKVKEDMYLQEREKAVNDSTDVFLLVTPAQATEFALPPRCGIVSNREFTEYFGSFASRAYRSLLEPPNINTASYHELRRIDGVGDATAEKIIMERRTRPFSSYEDALNRLLLNKNTASILSCMHYDHGGAN